MSLRSCTEKVAQPLCYIINFSILFWLYQLSENRQK